MWIKVLNYCFQMVNNAITFKALEMRIKHDFLYCFYMYDWNTC